MLRKKYKMLIQIEGMVCAGCAKRIENVLRALPAVQKVTVNFTTKMATIIATAVPDQDLVKKTIEDLEYHVVEITAA